MTKNPVKSEENHTPENLRKKFLNFNKIKMSRKQSNFHVKIFFELKKKLYRDS